MSIPPESFLLDPADARWLQFASCHPRANIFHHPAWLKLMADCYGYTPWVLAVGEDTENLYGGLPIMQVGNRWTGRRWVSLPYTDYCCPLVNDEQSLCALTDRLVNLSQRPHTRRVELRWEFVNHPAVQPCDQYVIHTIDLEPDFERVARGFDRVHRQNTRTAEKNQIEVRHGGALEDVREFYNLQVETRRRKGVPAQPWRYFELLQRSLMTRGWASVLLAYKEEECLAGLFLLHWNGSIIFKYAASSENTLNLRPNNLLFWSAIKWGCENGYRKLDMGRTDLDNTGLRRFKKGWGARETTLTYSMIATEPSSTKKSVTLVPHVMQTIIQRSPSWVCRLTGELLYGRIG